jgi:hypothetical protein
LLGVILSQVVRVRLGLTEGWFSTFAFSAVGAFIGVLAFASFIHLATRIAARKNTKRDSEHIHHKHFDR